MNRWAVGFQLDPELSKLIEKSDKLMDNAVKKIIQSMSSVQCPDCYAQLSISRMPEDGDVYGCGRCGMACVARIVYHDVAFGGGKSFEFSCLQPHQIDAMSDEARRSLAQFTRFRARGERVLFRQP